MMCRHLAPLALLFLALTAPALAQDAATNALRDAARAQERQAESLRRLEQVQRDHARQADRERINAQRDARSMRQEERWESRQFFR